MIAECKKASLDQEIREGGVVLDFYSEECGPCKMLYFILRDLDQVYGDAIRIIRIDGDDNPDLAEAYEVKGYPTLIFLKDGQEVQRKAGLQQKSVIENCMKEVMS